MRYAVPRRNYGFRREGCTGGFLPTGGNPGSGAQTRVTPNFTNPYAEEWTLGIQREINSNLAAEVRYVGTHTVHEFQTVNGNPHCAPQLTGGVVREACSAISLRVPAALRLLTPRNPGIRSGYANCNCYPSPGA